MGKPTNTEHEFSTCESHRLKIDQILSLVASPKQPLVPVHDSILGLSENDRHYAMHWLEVVAISNVELAYHYATLVQQAMEALPRKVVGLWISESLKHYDLEGLYPAVRHLRDIQGFAKYALKMQYEVSFKDMIGVLAPYLRGLSGRDLMLKKALTAHTDTDILFLPTTVSTFADRAKNKSLYKAMACFMWAQTWFGTFRKSHYDATTLEKKLRRFTKHGNIDKVYQLFLVLENVRLMACIERELPGLYREMSLLCEDTSSKLDNTWKTIVAPLKKPQATVEQTLVALEIYMSLNLGVPDIPYLGSLNLAEVEFCFQGRKQQQRDEIVDKMEQGVLNRNHLEEKLGELNSKKNLTKNSNQVLDEEDAELNALIESIYQDVESLQPDWLDELESSIIGSNQRQERQVEVAQASVGEQQEYYYDEWDFGRQQYREAWCRLVEKEVFALSSDFVVITKQKYRYLISKIRKTFEIIKDQSNLQRNQVDGEEIDIDAVIRMQANHQAGEEISDRFYMRKNHNKRSFAVLLLVDLSGSTKGWVNQLERESLVLIIEALEILGDQYAIYGFSGLTRQRCEIYPVKRFTNENKELTLRRIANLSAKDYTRMGAAIRHSTKQLNLVEARHKLLLVLSDGKPDDYDGYKGEYGLHDTRRSLDEAQSSGIKSFAITIDQTGQQYLPKLFGQHRYTILNDVNTLPQKLAEVYTRLTL